MPDTPPLPAPTLEPPQDLCASHELPERGLAYLFEVKQYRQSTPAFALRIDGQPVAYLNRCVHVPVPMDWQPGDLLDSSREYIICSIHGAAYEPQSGRCVAGPCGRGQLTRIELTEANGRVQWLPSRDIRPVSEPEAGAPPKA